MYLKCLSVVTLKAYVLNTCTVFNLWDAWGIKGQCFTEKGLILLSIITDCFSGTAPLWRPLFLKPFSFIVPYQWTPVQWLHLFQDNCFWNLTPSYFSLSPSLYIYVRIYLSIYLSMCLCIYLSIYLSMNPCSRTTPFSGPLFLQPSPFIILYINEHSRTTPFFRTTISETFSLHTEFLYNEPLFKDHPSFQNTFFSFWNLSLHISSWKKPWPRTTLLLGTLFLKLSPSISLYQWTPDQGLPSF